MNVQRNVLAGTIASVLVCFTLVFMMACDKSKVKYNPTTLVRPCDNVICLNGGTCKDGLCYCPQGFEGDKCSIRWSDRFVGQYQADDECYTGASGYYNVTINGDPGYAYKLNITNLGIACPNRTISAVINPEKTSFNIPMQNTCGDYYLSGYGNINGNYLNVFLKSRDSMNHTSLDCSIVMLKL